MVRTMPFTNLAAQVDRVWPMIEAAPGLFVLLFVACLGLAWGVVHLLHKQAFKNKDTEVSTKNAEIAWLRQQRDDAEKRLAAISAQTSEGAPPASRSPPFRDEAHVTDGGTPKSGAPLPSTGTPFDVVEDGGRVSFDYSTSNGRIQVGSVERLFVMRFTKASDTSIHLTKHGTNLTWIARVRDAPLGSLVDPDGLERSSDDYTIELGGLFMAQNQAGYILQGRIEHIADDGRGAERDELTFAYRIMLPRRAGIRSLRLKVLV